MRKRSSGDQLAGTSQSNTARLRVAAWAAIVSPTRAAEGERSVRQNSGQTLQDRASQRYLVLDMFSLMPFEQIILAPRYMLRVDDLSEADLLCVRCEGCGRDWRIGKALLMSRYPLHKRVLDIADGFRCRRCGSTICNWHTERAVPPSV